MPRIVYFVLLSGLCALLTIEGVFLYQQIAISGSLKEDVFNLQHQGEKFIAQIMELGEKKKELEREIDRLKKEGEELTLQKEEANRRVYDLARNGYAIKQPQVSQVVALSEPRYIRITAPNAGEALCLGEDYVIRWESSGISTVQIIFRGNGIGGAILDFAYPANLNETGDLLEGTYLWKVGKAGEADGQDLMAPAGGGYTFSLVSLDGATDASQAVVGKSDAPFSIVQCENRGTI